MNIEVPNSEILEYFDVEEISPKSADIFEGRLELLFSKVSAKSEVTAWLTMLFAKGRRQRGGLTLNLWLKAILVAHVL